jgi:hypothetical protein
VGLTASTPTGTGASSPWLRLARVVWAALVALSVALFVAGLLATFAPGFGFGALSVADPRYLGPADTGALAAMGLSVVAYAQIYTAIDVVFLLVFCAVPVLMAWRRGSDWLALAVSAALVMYGATLTLSFQTLMQQAGGPPLLPRALNLVSTVSVPILGFCFPDGRFVPRWTRWLVALIAVGTLLALLFPSLDPTYGYSLFTYPLFVGALLTVVYAQVYRYRRNASPAQRQQTKWVLFGFAVAVLGYTLLPLLTLFFPSLNQPGPGHVAYGLGFTVAAYLAQLAVPVTMGLSILRYRLWDIDLVINKGLVYLVVTGVLLVVFESGSHLVQKVIASLSGQESAAADFVPAVVVAAILSPVHEHTQQFVDRSFYREKLNLQQAFAALSHQVRVTTDLPELMRLLVDQACELLHLAHSAAYLPGADGGFELVESRGLPPTASTGLPGDPVTLARLTDGLAVSRPDDGVFPLLVPVVLPAWAREREGGVGAGLLAAVLALGPRLSGQGYSREDQTLLLGLTDQVGTAIYAARLAGERGAR